MTKQSLIPALSDRNWMEVVSNAIIVASPAEEELWVDIRKSVRNDREVEGAQLWDWYPFAYRPGREKSPQGTKLTSSLMHSLIDAGGMRQAGRMRQAEVAENALQRTSASERGMNGVNDGDRTRDNRNHNPVLYQLSYIHQMMTILAREDGTVG